MPDDFIHDPEEAIRRDNLERRGLDPVFHYSRHRFVTAAMLRKNIPHFIQTVGIEKVGFLMLSFRRDVRVKVGWRHLNNAWRRFLPNLFGHAITVVEFTKAGRPHFHIAAQTHADIRDGFDFVAYRAYLEANERGAGCGQPLSCQRRREMRNAIPANDALRQLWAQLDEGLGQFHLGPVYDLFPIETNEIAVSHYLSKEFIAGLPSQRRRDRGARLVSYSRNCPRRVPPGWRPPSPWFERRLAALLPVFGFKDRAQFQHCLGRRWAYGIMELIHWLEFDLGADWPDYPLFLLAPVVHELIARTGRIARYIGSLLPYVERVIRGLDESAQDVPPRPTMTPEYS